MQKAVNQFIAAWNLNNFSKMQDILLKVEYSGTEPYADFYSRLHKTSPKAYEYAIDIRP